MKSKECLWEKYGFSDEVNELINDNFHILEQFYLEKFYIDNSIIDSDVRYYLMDRFLIACSRYENVKGIFNLKKYLNACLNNSYYHYWPSMAKRQRKKNGKLYSELNQEEKKIYDLAEAYFELDEGEKGKTPEEIFAHQFICNLSPKQHRLLYYRYYYSVDGLPSGLSWQGVAKMMGTTAQSCKNMFHTIKKLRDETVFIDCGADGYGEKIMNVRTRKISNKEPNRDLFDIFREVEL